MDAPKGEISTRTRLLEAAGLIFADKGFDGATGKEICEQAGVNAASINYYFNNVEGLYAEVLQEAPRRLLRVEELQRAVAACTKAPDKLRAFVGMFIRLLAGPQRESWTARLIARELTHPSPAIQKIEAVELLPKANILRGIVGELMGLPSDHPAVAAGCITIMAPCFLLLVIDRPFLLRMFPALNLNDVEGLVRHLTEFLLGGFERVTPMRRKK